MGLWARGTGWMRMNAWTHAQDAQVLRALAVAKVFEGIEGKPPNGLLVLLKKNLGSHMKSCSETKAYYIPPNQVAAHALMNKAKPNRNFNNTLTPSQVAFVFLQKRDQHRNSAHPAHPGAAGPRRHVDRDTDHVYLHRVHSNANTHAPLYTHRHNPAYGRVRVCAHTCTHARRTRTHTCRLANFASAYCYEYYYGSN